MKHTQLIALIARHIPKALPSIANMLVWSGAMQCISNFKTDRENKKTTDYLLSFASILATKVDITPMLKLAVTQQEHVPIDDDTLKSSVAKSKNITLEKLHDADKRSFEAQTRRTDLITKSVELHRDDMSKYLTKALAAKKVLKVPELDETQEENLCIKIIEKLEDRQLNLVIRAGTNLRKQKRAEQEIQAIDTVLAA